MPRLANMVIATVLCGMTPRLDQHGRSPDELKRDPTLEAQCGCICVVSIPWLVLSLLRAYLLQLLCDHPVSSDMGWVAKQQPTYAHAPRHQHQLLFSCRVREWDYCYALDQSDSSIPE